MTPMQDLHHDTYIAPASPRVNGDICGLVNP